ncbi:MAG: hypothetical protein K0R75_3663 [Paenibacillaceae bacterium]|nr:hypothetical protein [Paenibacillaceae bacterium]
MLPSFVFLVKIKAPLDRLVVLEVLPQTNHIMTLLYHRGGCWSTEAFFHLVKRDLLIRVEPFVRGNDLLQFTFLHCWFVKLSDAELLHGKEVPLQRGLKQQQPAVFALSDLLPSCTNEAISRDFGVDLVSIDICNKPVFWDVVTPLAYGRNVFS